MGFWNNLFGNGLSRVVRLRNGSVEYITGNDSFGNSTENLQLSLTNMALFVALDLRATVFARGRFCVLDTNNEDEEIEKDPLIDIIKNPNFFDSQYDLLYKHSWFKDLGNNLIRVVKKRSNGKSTEIENVNSLQHLIPSAINYQDVNKIKKMVMTGSELKQLKEQEIKYKIDSKDYPIPVGDLLMYYDVASGMTPDSYFRSPSRIDAIRKELINIEQAQSTKNINLKFAAKHITSAKPDNSPNAGFKEVNLDSNESRDIEQILMSKDIHAVPRPLEVHALANDMRKLLLDDGISADAMRVFSVFRINKETLNWWLSGASTFDNRNQGVLEFMQTTNQYKADDFANTLQSHFGYAQENKKPVLKYDHMPIMRQAQADSEEKERDAREKTAQTIKTLVDAGVDLPSAMEYVGVENLNAAPNEGDS